MGRVAVGDEEKTLYAYLSQLQGHINPMLKLAKLLHYNGFFITFVNTLLNSGGLFALPDFRFASIPDGLQESVADATQDIPTPPPPPVTCIVSDGVMSFTLKVAERFELPEVLFWTASAAGFLGYINYRELQKRGYTPLQDMRQMRNGYLETVIDWIPGMKNIRLKDLPSFFITTDPQDFMIGFAIQETEAFSRANAVIFNTLDALESDVLNALSATFPRMYTS